MYAVIGLIVLAVLAFVYLRLYRRRRYVNVKPDGAGGGRVQGRWIQNITPFSVGERGSLGQRRYREGHDSSHELEENLVSGHPTRVQGVHPMYMYPSEFLPSYTGSLSPYGTETSVTSEDGAVSEASRLAIAPSSSFGSGFNDREKRRAP